MSRRFRILHLRASPFVGGPERQILRYAEYESGGPFEVILGTFVGHGEGEEFLAAARSRGIATLALPQEAVRVVSAFLSLLQFLAEHQVSLVCMHGYKADVLGTLACRIRGIPVACFVRGWTAEDSKVRLYEALDRALLPLATRVICLSEARARLLSEVRGFARKVRVIPNAIDPPKLTEQDRVQARRSLRARFGLAADTPVVGAAGRFSPEKGMSDFLEAVPEILRECPRAHFAMFGDGALREQLEGQAKRLGVRTVVHFPGFVAEVPKLLPGVDVLVNPSLSEEMPNIVLEGMAAAIPVVATAVGGLRELAGDDGSIVLLPPADPAALARAVANLLQNPVRARNVGCAGYERARRAFSPARQREQLRALYEELVGASVGSPQDSSSAAAPPVLQLRSSPLNPRGLPFVSVVIPVRNEDAYVGAVLEDLLRQEYPTDRYEILVVDANSTDRTAEIVEQCARKVASRIVRLLNPSGLSSAGRNVGVRHSRGELVVFVDGHCRIFSSTFLLDTVDVLESSGADCLCRPQPLLLPENTPFQNVVARVRASPLGHGLDSTIYGQDLEGFVNPMSSGATYRRRVFDQVGLYDERFDACEDVEFNYRVFRAGYRSYLSPHLTVFYSPRKSLAGLWQQMIRYGRGRFELMRKHPRAASLSQFVPGALVAWVVAGSLASFWSRATALVLGITLLAYCAMVLLFSAGLGMRYGWRHFMVAPAVYLTIHFGLGSGLWAQAGHLALGPLKRLRGEARKSGQPATPVAAPRQRPTRAAREAFEPEMK